MKKKFEDTKLKTTGQKKGKKEYKTREFNIEKL